MGEKNGAVIFKLRDLNNVTSEVVTLIQQLPWNLSIQALAPTFERKAFSICYCFNTH